MKIILGGEAFDFDGTKHPMSEALAVEKAWGHRYAEFESELAAGSAEAFCVLAWIVWRRDGRDVKLSDILDGAVDFDMAEFAASFGAGDEDADPTGSQSDLAGTPTTPPGTKARSRSS